MLVSILFIGSITVTTSGIIIPVTGPGLSDKVLSIPTGDEHLTSYFIHVLNGSHDVTGETSDSEDPATPDTIQHEPRSRMQRRRNLDDNNNSGSNANVNRNRPRYFSSSRNQRQTDYEITLTLKGGKIIYIKCKDARSFNHAFNKCIPFIDTSYKQGNSFRES